MAGAEQPDAMTSTFDTASKQRRNGGPIAGFGRYLVRNAG